MRRTITRTAIGAGLVAALFTGVAPAASASDAACTVTKDQRAAVVDQIHTLKGDLRGDRLTKTERTALRAAIAEMYRAAQDAKMSREARRAKRAEFVALAHKLGNAATAEERTAIRAEMRALALEIKAGKLTAAERRELRKKVHDMRRTLKTDLTKAERDAVRAQLRVLVAKLRCDVTA